MGPQDPLAACETVADLDLDVHEEDDDDLSDICFRADSQATFAADLSELALNVRDDDSQAPFATELSELHLGTVKAEESHTSLAGDLSDSDVDHKDDASDAGYADLSDLEIITETSPSKNAEPPNSPCLLPTPLHGKENCKVTFKLDADTAPTLDCMPDNEPASESENTSTNEIIESRVELKSLCEFKAASERKSSARKSEPLAEIKLDNVSKRILQVKRTSVSMSSKVDRETFLKEVATFTAEALDEYFPWNDRAYEIENANPVLPRFKDLKHLIHGKAEVDHLKVILKHFETDINREFRLRECWDDWLDRHPEPFNQIHRGTVVSWLAEMAEEREQDQSTYYLAIAYFDLFMAKTRGYRLEDLQLIGVAMLDVASRKEEHETLEIQKVLEYELADYQAKTLDYKRHFDELMTKIAKYELDLFNRMQGETVVPTAYDFLTRSLRLAALQEEHYDPQFSTKKGNRDLFNAMLSSATSDETTRDAMELLQACVVVYETRRFSSSLVAAAVFYEIYSDPTPGKRGFGGRLSDLSFLAKLTRECTGHTEQQLIETKALHLVRRVAALTAHARRDETKDAHDERVLIPWQRKNYFDPRALLLAWDPRLEDDSLDHVYYDRNVVDN
ncbi:Cyclin-A1 [Geranomyces michiganensis]|nr:Cyclin-A1 [Geranomyces michiganensis]